MGTAISKPTKVAPVSVTHESVCNSDSDRHAHLLGPSNTSVLRSASTRKRDRADCNSEGQDSEFSAEDDILGEVDRILAECEDTDERHNSRAFHKMPTISSKSSGLCNAKGDAINKIYSDSKPLCVKNYEVNTNNPTSNIQEKIIRLNNMMCNTNTKSTATASCLGIGVSSLGQPITYEASEEDLMNAIEREYVLKK